MAVGAAKFGQSAADAAADQLTEPLYADHKLGEPEKQVWELGVSAWHQINQRPVCSEPAGPERKNRGSILDWFYNELLSLTGSALEQDLQEADRQLELEGWTVEDSNELAMARLRSFDLQQERSEARLPDGAQKQEEPEKQMRDQIGQLAGQEPSKTCDSIFELLHNELLSLSGCSLEQDLQEADRQLELEGWMVEESEELLMARLRSFDLQQDRSEAKLPVAAQKQEEPEKQMRELAVSVRDQIGQRPLELAGQEPSKTCDSIFELINNGPLSLSGCSLEQDMQEADQQLELDGWKVEESEELLIASLRSFDRQQEQSEATLPDATWKQEEQSVGTASTPSLISCLRPKGPSAKPRRRVSFADEVVEVHFLVSS